MADEIRDETIPEQSGTRSTSQDGTQTEAPTAQTVSVDELEKARAQAAEYLDGWQRARADLANFRRRVDKEQAELTKNANSVLIARLLPVLDDLQRAFQTLPHNVRGLTWIEGIALIERKLAAILESEGLKPIDAVGKQFDPALHEAVATETTTDFPDGEIIAEYQKGYTLNERVLRPAMVKVAKRPDEQ